MRFRARLLLGVCGLVLTAPAVTHAAPPGEDEAAAATGAPPQQQSPGHHHKGIFGRRHCVECQRAYVKAHDGVDVPPPPALVPGAVPGPMGPHAIPGHMVDVETGECLTCQGRVPLAAGATGGDPNAPGYAVVGGPGMGGDPNAPGYAVVGETMQGPEPAPIGVARGHQPSWSDPRRSRPVRGRPQGRMIPRWSRRRCRRPRSPSPGPARIDRTSSATCSAFRNSAGYAVSVKTRSVRNTRRSPTISLCSRSTSCRRRWSTARTRSKVFPEPVRRAVTGRDREPRPRW